MIILDRLLENKIMRQLQSNKVLLLYGTRRVGKTFMIQSIMGKMQEKYLYLNGEDAEVQAVFQRRTIANFKNIIGDVRLLVIDEAQAIPGIGAALKLMIDTQPQLTILATGSSSLDLVNTSGEPLTGRNISYLLYPITHAEWNPNAIEARQQLDDRLIYGSYPEIFNLDSHTDKAVYLQQLIQSYLLKDILAYSGIRHAEKILSLLRLIAFQTGSEVSYSELSNRLGLNRITVENYLDLLSKVFIIFKLPAYSNNHRNEISKGAKWYFFDTGIRNAILNDFRPLALRNDVGALWESYIISERIKQSSYHSDYTQFYFWRTYQQQEIDLIEFENGQLRAFEVKYSTPRKIKTPSAFAAAYPETRVQLISKDNFGEYLQGKLP